MSRDEWPTLSRAMALIDLVPTPLVSSTTLPLGSCARPDSPSLAVTVAEAALFKSTGLCGQVTLTFGASESTRIVVAVCAELLPARSLTLAPTAYVPLCVFVTAGGTLAGSTPEPGEPSARSGSPLLAKLTMTLSLNQFWP